MLSEPELKRKKRRRRFTRQKQEDIGDSGNTDPMANKTFVITTILVRVRIHLFDLAWKRFDILVLE